MTIPNHLVTEHFKYTECTCECCNRLKITPKFYAHMELLERMRQNLGFPIIITSGYRCPAHNHAVAGAAHSQHMDYATDVRPPRGAERKARVQLMKAEAIRLGFGGVIDYGDRLHLDTRTTQYHSTA